MASPASADADVGRPVAEAGKALNAAARVVTPGPGFIVGVCDDAGQVVHCTSIGSFKQVIALSRRLARLGFACWIVGTTNDMQGCDILFARRAPEPDLLDAE
jgi:hypothetical protein